MAYPKVRATSKATEVKAKEIEIAWPAGTEEEDFGILIVTTRLKGTVPTVTTPEGWTLRGKSIEYGKTTAKRLTYAFTRVAGAGTTSATKVKLVASAEATGLSAQMVTVTKGTYNTTTPIIEYQNWSYGEIEECPFCNGGWKAEVAESLGIGVVDASAEAKIPTTEINGKKWSSVIAYTQYQATVVSLELPTVPEKSEPTEGESRGKTTAGLPYETMSLIIQPAEESGATPNLVMMV